MTLISVSAIAKMLFLAAQSVFNGENIMIIIEGGGKEISKPAVLKKLLLISQFTIPFERNPLVL